MKILYYVGTGSNKFGGLEKFNVELIRQLKTQSDNMEIAMAYKRPISCCEFSDSLAKANVSTYILYDSFNLHKHSLIRTAMRLRSVIKKEKPDIIHFNFGSSVELAVVKFLTGFKKIKIIYTEHCHIQIDTRRKYLVYKLVCACSVRILCVSEAITRSLRNGIRSRKLQTLYLGVPDCRHPKELCRKKLGLPDDEVIICNIAYHDRVKGVDILIKAVDYLKNKLGQTGFKVLQIGGAPFEGISNELRELLVRADVSDVMEFWGLRNDVDAILSASDIYCQPSRSEGIPLSNMEASMAEVPIVATNVGGIPEAAHVNENALLSESEDYISIAKDLQKLINEPLLRREMGKRGREIAIHNFSIDRQVARLVEIYKGI